MSNRNTTSSRRDRARMRIVAATKYFAKKSVIIDGEELQAKDLVAVFQRVLDSEDTVDATRATLREAINARETSAQKAARVSKALEGIVSAAFGPTSKAFAEFGFSPRRMAERSAETKALAVEKLRATRAARHTMGSRQKAAVHSVVDVSSPVVTPPSPPVAAAPAPSPAPVAAVSSNGGTAAAVLSVKGSNHP